MLLLILIVILTLNPVPSFNGILISWIMLISVLKISLNYIINPSGSLSGKSPFKLENAFKLKKCLKLSIKNIKKSQFNIILIEKEIKIKKKIIKIYVLLPTAYGQLN